jgi:hypothetical protein
LFSLPLAGAYLFGRSQYTPFYRAAGAPIMLALTGTLLLSLAAYFPLGFSWTAHHNSLLRERAERMKEELNPAQLARGCLQLIEEEAERGGTGYSLSLFPWSPSQSRTMKSPDGPRPPGVEIPSEDALPACIKSLRPSYLGVNKDGVVIEQIGGFDHFGYRFFKAPFERGEWILEWYTEGDWAELFRMPTRKKEASVTDSG